MYIVMIDQKNFQIIEDKAEAQRITEELAIYQKVYFFKLESVVETKLSWNKPSKSEKIKPSIQESIENNFDAGGVFVGPSKEVPVFRLPAYIDPNSPFNPLPIQDQSFEVYPKIRVCEESKDPDLLNNLTEIFDTSKAILEEDDNNQISITDYLDKLNNKDETIVIPAKSEIEVIELFDSEFEKGLETNQEKASELPGINTTEITQTFEVQEVSDYEVLEHVKESEITEQKVVEIAKETTEIKVNKIKKPSKKEREKNEEVKDIAPPVTQKIYKTSLGVTVGEEALKGACKNKFKNALEIEKTYKMYESTIKYLVSLYPEITNESWFNSLCDEYFESLSEDEKDKDIFYKAKKKINASESIDLLSVALDELEKVSNPEQLTEISKKYIELTDEKYIKAFEDKSDSFSLKDLETLRKIIDNPEYDTASLEAIYKLPKYQVLNLTKYKSEYESLFNVIIEKKKDQVQVPF